MGTPFRQDLQAVQVLPETQARAVAEEEGLELNQAPPLPNHVPTSSYRISLRLYLTPLKTETNTPSCHGDPGVTVTYWRKLVMAGTL